MHLCVCEQLNKQTEKWWLSEWKNLSVNFHWYATLDQWVTIECTNKQLKGLHAMVFRSFRSSHVIILHALSGDQWEWGNNRGRLLNLVKAGLVITVLTKLYLPKNYPVVAQQRHTANTMCIARTCGCCCCWWCCCWWNYKRSCKAISQMSRCRCCVKWYLFASCVQTLTD